MKIPTPEELEQIRQELLTVSHDVSIEVVTTVRIITKIDSLEFSKLRDGIYAKEMELYSRFPDAPFSFQTDFSGE